MVTPSAQVGATAKVAAPTVQTCTPGLTALLQPPISATADKVYFRDGDTRIGYLTPSGKTGDATTVPGSSSSVSFFSVSPDDERIAVLVEDFSAANTIGLRLYVEDVNGGGHHAEIYSTTTPKGPTATTLWPMGWHGGMLVLALIAACTNDLPQNVRPVEWHVSSASTGDRVVTIRGCTLSLWPSTTGVGCLDSARNVVMVFDWSGKVIATFAPPLPYQGQLWQSSISPSGQRIFFASQEYCGAMCPGNYTYVTGASGDLLAEQSDDPPACVWIDDTDMMSRNGVISLRQSSNPNTATVNARLPENGICAGRYPGGL